MNLKRNAGNEEKRDFARGEHVEESYQMYLILRSLQPPQLR